MRKSDIKDTTKPQKTAKKAVTSPKSVQKSKEQAQQTAEIATLNQTSLQERVLNFDLVNTLQQWCQKADKPFWTAFFTAFEGAEGRDTFLLGSCLPPALEFLSERYFVFLFIGVASFCVITNSISLGFKGGF